MSESTNIIFIGDSYCSACQHTNNHGWYDDQQQTDTPTWLDLSAQQLGLDQYCFGHAGRSWFYSRNMWLRYLEQFPSTLADTAVLVFCHTDSWRYNSDDKDIRTALLFNEALDSIANVDQDKKQALRHWLTYLRCNEFQEWAHVQWFREINRDYTRPDLKIVHFFAFPQTVQLAHDLLPGHVFTTPLIHLSLGEITGTDSQVTLRGMVQDRRLNHFSAENNRALADVLVQAVLNYSEGQHAIDPSKFVQVNPNAHRWPDPGFGTE